MSASCLTQVVQCEPVALLTCVGRVRLFPLRAMSEKRTILRVVSHAGSAHRQPLRVVHRKQRRVRIVRAGTLPPAPQQPVTLEDYQARLGKDRYLLREIIAAGGIGCVFRADDELLGMPVAIKSLNPEIIADPECVEALKREARLAMQLAHPHVVRLFNLVETKAMCFLVMEYVDGKTFHNILAEHGKLALDTVAAVVQACADALSHAHRHGILHNDMKPGNIMHDSRGVVRVIDFGTAGLKQVRAAESLSPDGSPPGDEGLSEEVRIEGTPDYMSPEQLRGEELDQRSDEFSLAVTAAEMLSGLRPFPRDISVDEHLERRGAPLLQDIPDAVRDVLARALQPDREQRWPSVPEFADAFAAAVEACD